MVNGELLYSSSPLRTAFCLLPAAFEEPQVRRAGPALPFFLPSAYCRLPALFGGGGMEKAFGRHGSAGQDATTHRQRKS